MSDTDLDLERARANVLRLHAQRQAALSRAAGLKDRGSQAVLSGKASDVVQELSQTQIEIELLDSAIGQAVENVRQAENDLRDRKMGQAGGAWRDFRKATQPRVERIYVELGTLNGIVEGLKVEAAAANARYHEGISGEPPSGYELRAIFDNIGRSIQEARRVIDDARPYLKVD